MKTDRKLWLGLAGLILLTPLGLLAIGKAWGEWSAQDLLKRLGFVPEGLRRLESLWNALLPGYTLPGWNTGWRAVIGYILSSSAGAAVIVLVTLMFGRWLTRRRP